MRELLVMLLLAAFCAGQTPATQASPVTPAPVASPAPDRPAVQELRAVRRIYVAQLTGGPAADALRELIIASLNTTRLFTLTEDPERADAILKGAADDKAFVDSFDSDKSLNDRADGGIYSGGRSSKTGGGYAGATVGDREAHHIRERKHEAYATVRLCSRSGDVIWSTTQESQGGKFRGASADVAAKIARQITTDFDLSHPPQH